MSGSTERKRILVVGGGGREHALAWSFAVRGGHDVFIAPGNAGTEVDSRLTTVRIAATDTSALVDFAIKNAIDLTVIGPEEPLVNGVVDAFHAAGCRAFGPLRQAAQLEGSKAFTKDICSRFGIATARAEVADNLTDARALLQKFSEPPVVKADGIAAGKGVIVASSFDEADQALIEILSERRFGNAGDHVVLEERLTGPEVSVLAVCDGESATLLPIAQDHKRLLDGDLGPNTGGMGAFTPSPLIDDALGDRIYEEVILPTLRGMASLDMAYRGVLYAGMMLTADGPKLLEFNCRLGDPEAQAIVPVLDTDLCALLLQSLEGPGALRDLRRVGTTAASCTVVMATAGYPTHSSLPRPIHGLPEAADAGCIVFHAGTTLDNDRRVLATGGRALAVTGTGSSLPEAIALAYRGASLITFEGAQLRSDIGRSVA